MRRATLGLAMLLLTVATQNTNAGPPFRTDDPVPVDLGHWEIYGLSQATHVKGDTSGALPGMEANYGAAPNLQLHVAASWAFDWPNGTGGRFGFGDLELGAKYRFVQEDEDGWRPQIATFPQIEVPTGDASRGLGGGHLREFIPIWLQKGFGRWLTYGGGGYWNNPGAGNKNYWFAGWLIQYQLRDDLALGGEIFHQTADTVHGSASTGFNLGGVYDLSDNYHLLFSVGSGIQHAAATNLLSYYLALQWTF
jgi:hypothetical protein